MHSNYLSHCWDRALNDSVTAQEAAVLHNELSTELVLKSGNRVLFWVAFSHRKSAEVVVLKSI
jgi:hypothetical protein